MAGKPKNPEEVYDAFVADCREIYGEGVLSVVVFGSAARGEYRKGHSDINFLVVLDEKSILDLEHAFDKVRPWEKRAISIPLFLTGEYIRGALDSYPLEFLDMKSAYRVLYGVDPLESLPIEMNALRLQCERDARRHLLHLRQGYLASRGRERPLRRLISISLPGFYALFRGIVHLLGADTRLTPVDLTRRVSEACGLDMELFERLEKIRLGKKVKEIGTVRLVDLYLEEIRKLVLWIDRMEIASSPPGGEPGGVCNG